MLPAGICNITSRYVLMQPQFLYRSVAPTSETRFLGTMLQQPNFNDLNTCITLLYKSVHPFLSYVYM